MRPLLLDVFCGAGGASTGYNWAGFDVVGIDISPQPRYPFQFVRGDALEYLAGDLRQFDAIHASPPCQFYSAMSACRPGLAESYPNLIGPTRELLQSSGLPWVIENVPLAAPFLRNPIELCGHMFGLKLYRHRLFELSEFSWSDSDEFRMAEMPYQPEHQRHVTPASKAGHWVEGTIISVSGDGGPGAAEARGAMGIDWMNRHELAEAIPPAYTEYIGRRLLEDLEVAA